MCVCARCIRVQGTCLSTRTQSTQMPKMPGPLRLWNPPRHRTALPVEDDGGYSGVGWRLREGVATGCGVRLCLGCRELAAAHGLFPQDSACRVRGIKQPLLLRCHDQGSPMQKQCSHSRGPPAPKRAASWQLFVRFVVGRCGCAGQLHWYSSTHLLLRLQEERCRHMKDSIALCVSDGAIEAADAKACADAHGTAPAGRSRTQLPRTAVAGRTHGIGPVAPQVDAFKTREWCVGTPVGTDLFHSSKSASINVKWASAPGNFFKNSTSALSFRLRTVPTTSYPDRIDQHLWPFAHQLYGSRVQWSVLTLSHYLGSLKRRGGSDARVRADPLQPMARTCRAAACGACWRQAKCGEWAGGAHELLCVWGGVGLPPCETLAGGCSLSLQHSSRSLLRRFFGLSGVV